MAEIKTSVGDKLIKEKRFFSLILMWFLTHLMKLIARTCRYRIVCEEYYKEIFSEYQSVVYVFWHQNILFSLLTKRSSTKEVCLISRSQDGDLIAYPCEKIGMRVVRGSSGKLFLKATNEFKDYLNEGYSGVIAIDGPVGPAQLVKPGAIYFASKLGVPVFPIRAFSPLSIKLPTWDKMRVPIPFSTVYLVYAKPLKVGTNLDKSGIKEWSLKVQKSLDELEKMDKSCFLGKSRSVLRSRF